MDGNAKNTEDDAGYGIFVIGGTALSTICKINEAIGYLLRVEFAWGNLLMKALGGSDINTSEIHDGMVWAAIQLADDVLD